MTSIIFCRFCCDQTHNECREVKTAGKSSSHWRQSML